MLKKIVFLLIIVLIAYVAPSCNHNKIACPTYADSFPEKKKKHGKDPTTGSKGASGPTGATGATGYELPPVTKSRLSIMPPGYK
jgi:hypothetical protein